MDEEVVVVLNGRAQTGHLQDAIRGQLVRDDFEAGNA